MDIVTSVPSVALVLLRVTIWEEREGSDRERGKGGREREGSDRERGKGVIGREGREGEGGKERRKSYIKLRLHVHNIKIRMYMYMLANATQHVWSMV